MLLVPENIQQTSASIVLLLESSGLSVTPNDIENRLGVIVDGIERVFGPEAPGTAFRIPKYNLDVVVTKRRWELNSASGPVNETTAANIANTIQVLNEFIKEPSWKAIGYNYSVIFTAPESKSAIEAILASTIDTVSLNKKLGNNLNGAAVWLYSALEQKPFWLRLEPRNSDRNSKFVWAYGNYEDKLKEILPTYDNLRVEFIRLYDIFLDYMKRL